MAKNVCHGVVWTRELHVALLEHLDAPARTGLATTIAALDRYLLDKGVGKAMHDLVAAACVLDEAVCEFAEVEIFERRANGVRERVRGATRGSRSASTSSGS